MQKLSFQHPASIGTTGTMSKVAAKPVRRFWAASPGCRSDAVPAAARDLDSHRPDPPKVASCIHSIPQINVLSLFSICVVM